MKDKQGVMLKVGSKNDEPVYKELQFETLTKLPLAQYLSLKGRFANTESAKYYDTAIFKAGLPITPAHKVQLFANGIGSKATLANDPTTDVGAKTEALTNMTSNGQFSNGEDFILEGMEAKVVITSTDFTFSRGSITAPNNAAADPAGFSAANHVLALNDQMKLSFIRGARTNVIFQGLLGDFPSSQLLAGAFGNVADGFVQNIGMGSYRILSNARVLGSQEPFHVVLEPLAESFTPQTDFNIRVTLVGTYIGTLYE